MRPAVRVRVDPARLAAYGLSMEDVRTAVAQRQRQRRQGRLRRAAAGVLAGRQRPAWSNAGAYRDLVIAWRNGAPVRLSAVGSVIGGVENDRVGAWYFANGKRRRWCWTSSASPAPTSCRRWSASRQALPALQQAIPAGIKLTHRHRPHRDDPRLGARRAVHADHVGGAGGAGDLRVPALACARPSFPAVALPLSLIGTFGVMAPAGLRPRQSVADGADRRHRLRGGRRDRDDRERGALHRSTACRRWRPRIAAPAQIGFTIVSLTVSLIAVFIPLLFMTGVVGRLFSEFAVTLSVAVVVSAVVSLTLTPMMCGRLLRPAEEQHPGRWLARWSEAASIGCWLATAARCWALRHQALVLLVACGDAGRHDRALYRGAQGVPAAAGHRRAGGGDRGRAERLDPAPDRRCRPQAAADHRPRPGGDRRRLVRRRRHDQRDAEHRAADHRAEADRAARRGGRGDRPAAARHRRRSPG